MPFCLSCVVRLCRCRLQDSLERVSSGSLKIYAKASNHAWKRKADHDNRSFRVQAGKQQKEAGLFFSVPFAQIILASEGFINHIDEDLFFIYRHFFNFRAVSRPGKTELNSKYHIWKANAMTNASFAICQHITSYICIVTSLNKATCSRYH